MRIPSLAPKTVSVGAREYSSALADAQAVLKRAFIARFLSLPIQSCATAAATYITIRALGVSAYATIGLLIGLQTFGNLITLGSTAAVSTASAGMSDRTNVDRTVVSALRAMFFSTTSALLASACIGFMGWWPAVLGGTQSRLLVIGAVVAIVGTAISQMAGVPATMLIAAGHASTAIWTICFGSIAYLAGAAVLWMAHASAIGYVAIPFVGQLAGGMVASQFVARKMNFSFLQAIGRSLHPSFPGRQIRGESLPVLIIWISLPIAYQTDRLLLSHLSTPTQLATYNITAQLFSPLLGAVTLAASSLWGHFAGARRASRLIDARSFVSLSLRLGLLGCLLGSGFIALAPVASRILSNGLIRSSVGLCGIFAVFLALQAFHQPSAMVQTDRAGLRFNSVAVVVMTAVNIALGIVLTPRFGASGPIAASAISLALLLATPSFARGARRLERHSDFDTRPSG